MDFQLGLAVWSFKGWVGSLFPGGSRAGDFLNLYSRRFNTVEGNTTFYAVPDRDTMLRWAADVPPGFEFCLKLPRDLTHNGLLEPSIEGALRFEAHTRALGDRRGPTFVQLPPGYGPEWMDDLATFLSAWPRAQAPLALEVRNLEFFRDACAVELNDLLRSLGVARVLLDSRPIYEGPDDPQLQYERRKPRVPLQPVTTAPFSMVRFISHPLREANQSYLDEWVIRSDRWLKQGTKLYFFVHCPIEEFSPLNARHFQTLLEQRGAPVPPLPWNKLPPPPPQPAQLKLF